jgi:hypothetical protein
LKGVVIAAQRRCRHSEERALARVSKMGRM